MWLPIIAWDNERNRRQIENDESRRLPLYIPEYPPSTSPKESDDGIST